MRAGAVGMMKVVSSGPATEDVAPAGTWIFGSFGGPSMGTLLGGGSIRANLADASDSTGATATSMETYYHAFVWAVFVLKTTPAFDALTLAAGRTVDSVDFIVRAKGTGNLQVVSGISGVTLAGGTTQTLTGSYVDYTFNFTKSGGGTLTEAQVNAMEAQAVANGSNGGIVTFIKRVHYT